MASKKKIVMATCPYCGNDFEANPAPSEKNHYIGQKLPKVGDIKKCPYCSWRSQVEGIHRDRLILTEYVNANRMHRNKAKKNRESVEAE